MGFFRILYWGLSYSTGLVCMTSFFLRYLQKRDKFALKMVFFLLPFGLSMASLSIMEGFDGSRILSGVAGRLALIGASIVVATFPNFALGFDEVKTRRRFAFALKILGIVLTLFNIEEYFFRIFPSSAVAIATFLSLGVAIFTGMAWITRGSVRWDSKRRPAWMASLFVFFGAVIVLDFFRSLFPALASFGWRYMFLPGFYAYLNVFLLYTHLRLWALAPDAAERSVSAESLVERFGVSKRETEVLLLLARGRTYSEIADSLCVSLATIKSHVSHLFEKTGARNKVELINLLYDSAASAGIQPKSG